MEERSKPLSLFVGSLSLSPPPHLRLPDGLFKVSPFGRIRIRAVAYTLHVLELVQNGITDTYATQD